MADMRRRVKCFVDISLIIQACMLVYVAARASGNSEASLSAAEKLVTEALRKEINNELKEIVSSSNEKLRETSDGVGGNAEVRRDAASDGKSMEQMRAGMAKTEAESNKVQDKGKMSFAGVPPDQKRHAAKNSGLNDNRFKEQVKEMLLDEMTMPVRNDIDDEDLYQMILRSLKQYPSQHDSGSRHYEDEYEGHRNPKFASKQFHSSNPNKGNVNAKPAARHSKVSEDWHQLSDDEIEAKVSEFYNALQDYADNMQTGPAQKQKDGAAKQHALPLDQPLKPQHHALPLDQPLRSQHHALPLDQPFKLQHNALPLDHPLRLQHHALPLDHPLRLQHHALPLDHPLRLSSSRGGKQRKVALSQKRTRDNRKLVADLEQLAETLKKEEKNSPNDAFPSFAQWFRHQRSLSSLRQEKDATSYNARLHSDAMADVFRGAEASDLDTDFPWSKYFNRDSKSVEQMTKREATDSDEENFIDEIEKRVAKLQRQLDAKREMKEGTALRM